MCSTNYYFNRPYWENVELGGLIKEEKRFSSEESLYYAKGNRYFLRIKHCIKTLFWRILGNKVCKWSVSARHLSKEDAREWVMEYLGTESYKNIFGELDG